MKSINLVLIFSLSFAGCLSENKKARKEVFLNQDSHVTVSINDTNVNAYTNEVYIAGTIQNNSGTDLEINWITAYFVDIRGNYADGETDHVRTEIGHLESVAFAITGKVKSNVSQFHSFGIFGDVKEFNLYNAELKYRQ